MHDNDDGLEEWSEDLEPWTDPAAYSLERGSDLWLGCGEVEEPGPLRGWWIRRLRIWAKKFSPDAGDPIWSCMVLWLAEASGRTYVSFVTPEDTYHPGSAGGYWQIDLERLKGDLPKAYAWASGAAAGSLVEGLDGLLADPTERMATAPRELSAGNLLGPAAKDTWLYTRTVLRNRWPRPCEACAESFRPERAGLVRCLVCRRAGRTKTVKPTPTSSDTP